jgi:hypothetical protein
MSIGTYGFCEKMLKMSMNCALCVVAPLRGTKALRVWTARIGGLAKNGFHTLYKGLVLWGKARGGIALRRKGLRRFWAVNRRKSVEILGFS